MSKRSILEEIRIRNLGIIEESALEFGAGLNVVTGETGAGKTMILTALGLVLGEKSDSSLVRHGSDRLSSSATFIIPDVSPLLSEVLEQADVALEDHQLILGRSVTAEAKSKATANGSTVTATFLSEATKSLIEIHGQSANLEIIKSSHQRDILDKFGGDVIAIPLARYSASFEEYRELKARIAAMKKAAGDRDQKIANIKEFVKASKALAPELNEYSTTNDQISRLSSVEDLQIATSGAQQAISTDEASALTSLNAALKFLASVHGRDSALDEITERIKEGFYQIDEAYSDLAGYIDRLEADPTQLNFLQDRKASLLAFIKKFGGAEDPDVEIAHLVERAKSADNELADLVGGDDRIAQLESELIEVKKKLLASAQELTSVRESVAARLSERVTEEIHHLSMPHTTLSVQVAHVDYEGSLKESDFTPHGSDEVSIAIRAHADGPLIAIGKGVSGGEMSRIMLALSVVIAESYPVGTYIFDEVDAGVGGAAAIEVGRRLHRLAKTAQVIVVTHLPQVAAWADTHFKVEKSTDGSVVASGVMRLSEEARVDEIARMLAGLSESTSAREHAAELLSMRE